jgi:hypothetical protein
MFAIRVIVRSEGVESPNLGQDKIDVKRIERRDTGGYDHPTTMEGATQMIVEVCNFRDLGSAPFEANLTS